MNKDLEEEQYVMDTIKYIDFLNKFMNPAENHDIKITNPELLNYEGYELTELTNLIEFKGNKKESFFKALVKQPTKIINGKSFVFGAKKYILIYHPCLPYLLYGTIMNNSCNLELINGQSNITISGKIDLVKSSFKIENVDIYSKSSIKEETHNKLSKELGKYQNNIIK